MTAEIQRDLGKHDAQIEALEKDIREIKEDSGGFLRSSIQSIKHSQKRKADGSYS